MTNKIIHKNSGGGGGDERRIQISRLKGLTEYPEQQIKRDSQKAYYCKLSTHCRQREGPQSFHIVKRGHIQRIRNQKDF